MHFTGDLEHKIITNPFFFKTEKTYLRAQIARIVHSTTIIPKGLYKTNPENDKEVDETQDAENPFVLPNSLKMGSADSWVHYPLGILRCNLTAVPAPTNLPDDADPADALKKAEAADP